MAKDKERSVNPAQQQRKLEKAKALKKGKAEVQARRNEKLARQNPDRIQRQIDDLEALEESGSIKPREKQVLQDLERDLRAIKKARGALGDKAPQFGKIGHARERDGNDRGEDGVLGKRRWDREREPHSERGREQSSGSETDESVRRIPMPKDTPPPITHRRVDRKGTNANTEPLGEGRGNARPAHGLPQVPVKTTYESAAQVRDLKKEAVGRFVPNVVRRKQETVRGTIGLVEPEELDRLEREGYIAQTGSQTPADASNEKLTLPSGLSGNAAPPVEADDVARRLAAEEERFRREMKHVEMEEVEDEDL
jgi:WW domain binding protein 11